MAPLYPTPPDRRPSPQKLRRGRRAFRLSESVPRLTACAVLSLCEAGRCPAKPAARRREGRNGFFQGAEPPNDKKHV